MGFYYNVCAVGGGSPTSLNSVVTSTYTNYSGQSKDMTIQNPNTGLNYYGMKLTNPAPQYYLSVDGYFYGYFS